MFTTFIIVLAAMLLAAFVSKRWEVHQRNKAIRLRRQRALQQYRTPVRVPAQRKES